MSGSSEGRRGSADDAPDVRATATRVVERTLTSGVPSSALLDAEQRRFSPRDGALLRELTLGTLRWLRRLDHVAEAASGRPIGRIDKRLRGPLRIGIYQLLFLDRVPAYAAVDQAVSEARRRAGGRAAGFVNAVMRRVARSGLDDWPVREREPIPRLGIEHSHPDHLVEAWLERFGVAATTRLLRINNQPRRLQLLAFGDRGGRRELIARLAEEGVDVERSELSPRGLIVTGGDPIGGPSFRRGDFYVQDAASQAAALLPPPGPRERILDAAAAPGGKSFAMLAWEPTCRLTAMDLSPERLRVLRANLARLRREVPVVAGSAAQPPFGECFERVVVDLPCSGTGILRKHPELKWRSTGAEIERLSRNGLEMLRGAALAVGRGGLLVVITCSIERRENEWVVERFLERRPDFARLPLDDAIPVELRGGIESEGRWRKLPAADHDGFTAHVLARG